MGMQVCSPWADPDRMCNAGPGTTDDCVDGEQDLVYKWTDEEYLLAASNLLYVRTGFRWPGTCGPFDVWPCVDNCSSDRHDCVPCCAYNVIALPSDLPILEVTSITEDGDELDPSAYRVETRGRIVRIDGGRWQRNTFGLPCAVGQGVETIVTYTTGSAPPIDGVMAAVALAEDMKRACNGESCSPGSNLASYARRGVSVDLVDIEELMKRGTTGIPVVDRFLATYERVGRSMNMADPANPRRGARVI